MNTVRKNAGKVVLLVVLAAMGVVTVHSALAAPATVPRPSDIELAGRTETPPADHPDPRIERPDGAWLGALGIIEPSAPESRLGPAVGGRIASIGVGEGEQVEAGAILVELESAVERAALAAAEADVAVAEAELVRTRRGVRSEDFSALSRDAEAAAARAELSAGVLARLEAAARGGGATVDEVERARRQADADRLLALSASSRQSAGRSGRREDTLVAQARLQVAIARRDQAHAELERRRIVAPHAGEVLEIHNRVGEYVQPAGVEPVVVLADTRTLRARIDIDERDVGSIEAGRRAVITVDSYPGREFAGEVVWVARRMGRKNIRTDEPTERIDTTILEVVVDLGVQPDLIVGQRVMGYVAAED